MFSRVAFDVIKFGVDYLFTSEAVELPGENLQLKSERWRRGVI